MIIVDTSVLIDFLKGEDTRETRVLAELEENGFQYAIPLVCLQEVLQGARDHREWKLLEQYLSSQVLLEPQDYKATHVAAARLPIFQKVRSLSCSSLAI